MSTDTRVLTTEGLQAVRRWHLALAAVLAGLVLFLPGLARFKPVQCLSCGGAAVAVATPAPIAAAPLATPAATVATAPTAAAPAEPASAIPTTGSAASAAPVAAAAAAAPAAALAPVTLFYASGAWALPARADATLAPLVAALKTRPEGKLVISGFHDANGDPRRNHDLALKRARTVAQALQAAGVDPARIELLKPQETTGGSDPAQARRVEVSLRS